MPINSKRVMKNRVDNPCGALIFWLAGVTIFWSVEFFDNISRKTISGIDKNILFILLLYVLFGIFAFVLLMALGILTKRILKAKLKADSDCFNIASAGFLLIFLYSFLWVNEKNPSPLYSALSIAIDLGLLLASLAYCVFTYFLFKWFKKRGDFAAHYFAYSLSLYFLLICGLNMNWQLYRESVWAVENFLTINTLAANIVLVFSALIIYILTFYFYLFLKKAQNYIRAISLIILVSLVFAGIGLIQDKKPAPAIKRLISANNQAQRPNVMLILLDTLRADHLGCYGYGRNTSPNIDNLSQSGVIFEKCFTPTPITQLVIPSLLTSRYISFAARKDYKFVKSLVRLQEILKANDYKTAGFIGFNFANQLVGPEKGFDYFFNQFGVFNEFFLSRFYITFLYASTTNKNAWEFPYAAMEDELFSWITKNKNNKFFVYLHITDIHAPYQTPASYKKKFFRGSIPDENTIAERWRIEQNKFPKSDIEDVIDLYDDSISSVDESIKKLTDKLKSLGLLDNTMIILLSDHGEAFLEHGVSNHGRSVFEEEIHVPLIFRYPRSFKQGARLEPLVSSIDVTATILDALGINTPDNINGNSLLSLIAKGNKEKAGLRKNIFSYKEGNFAAIRTDRFKLIICEESKKDIFGGKYFAHKNLRELYDLKAEPRELNNIYLEEKDSQLRKSLEEELIRNINFIKDLVQ